MNSVSWLAITAFGVNLIPLTLLWIVSVFVHDSSIIDIYWGILFVVANATYFIASDPHEFTQKEIVTSALV